MKRLLSALIVVAALVTGCAHIPTSGPIENIPVSPRPRSVELAPEPPQPGVTPQRLVEGFMQAMVDPEADYGVAREYLTPDAAAAWDPASGAVIYDGDVAVREDTAVLDGVALGNLNELGHYTSIEDDLLHDFGLEQVDGEWRIGAPPSGLLLSRYYFQRYYAHVSVYFIARSGGWVVPDLIHVPDAQLTAARVVEAQLRGPSSMVGDTVRNALATVDPDALVSASIDNAGIVTVEFDDFPMNLPDDRRREVGAQLMWSLTAIPRVTGLRVEVDGAAWRIPGQTAAGVLELSSQQGYQVLSRATSPDLFAVKDGQLGRVTAANTFMPFADSDALAGLNISDLAVSLDGSQMALVDQGRRMVLVGTPESTWSPELPALERIDAVQFATGNLWVLGEISGSSSLIRYDGSRVPQRIDLSAVPGNVVGFAISENGTRAALVVQQGARSVLGMAALQVGTRTRVVDFEEIPMSMGVGASITDPMAVDWSAETELAVLAEAGGTPSVFLIALDGSVVEDLELLNASPVELTALPRLGGDAIVVREADGAIHRREGTRWASLALELDRVSFPG